MVKKKKNINRKDIEHFKWLKNRIEKLFGKRCPDFCEDCIVCSVWQFYDDLRDPDY